MEKGYSENQAADIIQHLKPCPAKRPCWNLANSSLMKSAFHIEHGKRLELEERQRSAQMRIESAGTMVNARRPIMKDALADIPLFLSKTQQAALCRMDTPENAQIVVAMLESIGKMQRQHCRTEHPTSTH